VSTLSRLPSLLNLNLSVITRLSGLIASSKELDSSDDDDDGDDDEYISSNAETASHAATLREMMLLRQQRKASAPPVDESIMSQRRNRTVSLQMTSTPSTDMQSPVPSLSPPPKRSSLVGSLQIIQHSAKHRKTQSQPQLNTESNRISRQVSKSWKGGGPSLLERIKEKGFVGGVDAD